MVWTIGIGLLAAFTVACSGGGDGGNNLGGTTSAPSAQVSPVLISPDPSDPTLASFTQADGSTFTLIGTKNASGMPTSITAVEMGDLRLDPQKHLTIAYDPQGRPTRASLGTGEAIDFDYSLDSKILMLIKSPSGVPLVTLQYDPATGTAQTVQITQSVSARAVKQDLHPSRSSSAHSLVGRAGEFLAGLFTTSAEAQGTPPFSASVKGNVSLKCGGSFSPDATPSGYFNVFYDRRSILTQPIIPLKFSPGGQPGSYQYSFLIPSLKTLDQDGKVNFVKSFVSSINNQLETICSLGFNRSEVLKGNIERLEQILAGSQQFQQYFGNAGAVVAANVVTRFMIGRLPDFCTLARLANPFEYAELALDVIVALDSLATYKGTLEIAATHPGGSYNFPEHPPINPQPNELLPPITLDIPQNECVVVKFAETSYKVSAGNVANVIVTRTLAGKDPTQVYVTVNSGDAERWTEYEPIDAPGALVTLTEAQPTAAVTVTTIDSSSSAAERFAVARIDSVQRGKNSGTDSPVRITFGKKLTVTKSGFGAPGGRVTSSPAGIDCGTACKADISDKIVLTAPEVPHTKFKGWAGDCTGSGSCEVDTRTGPKNVEAKFDFDIVVTWNAFGPPLGVVYTSFQQIFYEDGSMTNESWGGDSAGNRIQLERPVPGVYTWFIRSSDHRLFVLTNGVLAVPGAPGATIYWNVDHWEIDEALFKFK